MRQVYKRQPTAPTIERQPIAPNILEASYCANYWEAADSARQQEAAYNNSDLIHVPINQIYEDIEKNRILNGEWLSDISVHIFYEILKNSSNFIPRDTLLSINHLENRNATRIQPVSRYQEHLQIIHTRDYWICVYFDKKTIFIYNSIHRNNLTEEQKVIIRVLFPYVEKHTIS